MKIISNDMPQKTKLQVERELLALQKTSQADWTIQLMDYFSDGNGNTYFLTKLPTQTLADVI